MAEIDTISASIASGQSLSAQIDIGNKSVVGIIVPANWTTAAITLQGSADGGTTWAEVVDQTASAVGCSSLPGGTLVYFVAIDPAKLRGLVSLKIRSGTQAAAVVQVNTVALSVITRLAV